MKRYILVAANVRSRRTGQEHWVSAEELLRLYGLPREQCVLTTEERLAADMAAACVDHEEAIFLYPRYDGRYRQAADEIREIGGPIHQGRATTQPPVRSFAGLAGRIAAFMLAAILGISVAWAADLSITDTTTVPSTAAVLETKVAGEAIKAGQPVYQKASDHKIYLAENHATTAEATAIGLAACNAATGQPVTYQKSGDMTIGATLVSGTSYVVSVNKGKVAPAADLASGDYITILGTAKSTSVLTVGISVTGAKR